MMSEFTDSPMVCNHSEPTFICDHSEPKVCQLKASNAKGCDFLNRNREWRYRKAFWLEIEDMGKVLAPAEHPTMLIFKWNREFELEELQTLRHQDIEQFQ
ncbi:unnamed protein product [Polarella glacialis]|uniref:Uncharacterized protein n=1 Tax=Polarella glacialis TaxID=89957 RepID=A0A813GG35_POLGL|nr:unnamed protein product [Polarella glacialis]